MCFFNGDLGKLIVVFPFLFGCLTLPSTNKINKSLLVPTCNLESDGSTFCSNGPPTMGIPKGSVVSFYDEHCVYLPPMLGWFLFSALLSIYNKFVFGNGHMAFPCPLLLTSMHFGIQWFLSHMACALFPVHLGSEQVERMGWKEWSSISIPCGLVTAFDVGLSNLSLVTITITFYTMVKSSTPIFVLGWAYIFGIEKITLRLIGVILVIASGEFLTVLGEVDFVLHGFMLCLIASILSGARWTLVQMKLQNLDPPLKSAIVTMKLLAPSMFFGMLFISLLVEQPWTKFPGSNGNELSQVIGLGVAGGILAVAMVLCEFYLILHSTAIILMIGGVIKEMVTILIGVTIFGDNLNATNISGFAVVFSGVILYKIVFHLDKAEKLEVAENAKNRKENVGSKLMHDSEDEYEDEPDQVDFIRGRGLELVGRTSGKTPPFQRKLVKDDMSSGSDETPPLRLV